MRHPLIRRGEIWAIKLQDGSQKFFEKNAAMRWAREKKITLQRRADLDLIWKGEKLVQREVAE